MYQKELAALKKANRYRTREIYNKNLIDLASNDYLGLSENRKVLKKACKSLKKENYHSSKASMLVNGYHLVHQKFETYMAKINSFESAVVVGSGFLANLALIEALPRKRDILIIDEKYHASGILASKLVDTKVVFFRHNDAGHLREILQNGVFYRAIVAVEGVYSMEGDLLNKEIFDVTNRDDTLLIVDEAHSVGVVGEKLLGIFEHYGISIKKNHIKMGTLGKALGSYGAYILCCKEVENYLLNRAKSIIYATAVSPFDISLAYYGMRDIQKNIKNYKQKIQRNQNLVKKYLDIEMDSLILKIDIENSGKVMELKKRYLKKGYLIGAIRPPTVERSILRIIPRLKVKKDILKEFLKSLRGEI